MKSIRMGFITVLACLSMACMPLLSGLGAMMGAPPQAPAAVINISRGAVDFALNAFDAGLYAFDLAMDLGKPKAGSPEAKRIAAVGRKVVSALKAVEAARDAGNSASYEDAFRSANLALTEFKALLGRGSDAAAFAPLLMVPGTAPPQYSAAQRLAILDRAAA
jgi:hypothetical protein